MLFNKDSPKKYNVIKIPAMNNGSISLPRFMKNPKKPPIMITLFLIVKKKKFIL